MIGESVARRSEHLRPSSLASPERQHGQGARSELGISAHSFSLAARPVAAFKISIR